MNERLRHIQLGNELADILESKHYIVPVSMREVLCDEFKKIVPILRGEAQDSTILTEELKMQLVENAIVANLVNCVVCGVVSTQDVVELCRAVVEATRCGVPMSRLIERIEVAPS